MRIVVIWMFCMVVISYVVSEIAVVSPTYIRIPLELSYRELSELKDK